MRTRIQRTATWACVGTIILMWMIALGGCGHVTPDSFGTGAGGSLTAHLDSATAALNDTPPNVPVAKREIGQARPQAVTLTERCGKAEQKLVELDDDVLGPWTWRNIRRFLWILVGLVALIFAVRTILKFNLGPSWLIGTSKLLYGLLPLANVPDIILTPTKAAIANVPTNTMKARP